MLIISHADKIGLRFIYPLAEYAELMQSGKFLQLSHRQNMKALGFNLWNAIKGAWNNVIKPIISVAAPVVGGLFGGPAGAMIGQGVSSLLNGRPQAARPQQQQQQARYPSAQATTRPSNGAVTSYHRGPSRIAYGGSGVKPFWLMAKVEQKAVIRVVLRSGKLAHLGNMVSLLCISDVGKRLVEEKRVPVTKMVLDLVDEMPEVKVVEIVDTIYLRLVEVKDPISEIMEVAMANSCFTFDDLMKHVSTLDADTALEILDNMVQIGR
jgi:hypothetical protein